MNSAKALNLRFQIAYFVVICAVFLLLAVPCIAASAVSGKGGGFGWNFEYDDGDRITKVTDPAGRETRFQYTFDSTKRLGQLVRIHSGGAGVTQEFDESGRIIRMTDGESTASYGYDDWGRLNRVQRQGAPPIAYSYDTLDRITTLQVGELYRIEYGYDFLGRLESMRTPAGVIRYEYLTGQGQVVRTLPNGVKTFWKRQPNGELDRVTHGYFKKPGEKTYSVLAEFAYFYGPEGRIASISERTGQAQFVRRYEYDTMGRLTKATGPNGREYRYEYDLFGNRTRAASTGRPDQVCTYDWLGRLTGVGGKPSRYDAAGNLAEVTLGGVTRQYRYDLEGHLKEAQVGDETVQYRYDGFGRLVARKIAVGEARFIPDPLSQYWQPLIMEEPGGERTLIIWDGPIPLAMMRNGKVEWLLHDHLGSVRLVTDAMGGVIRRNEYDPFGVPAAVEQSMTLAPGFAGLFWDGTANGYLALARTYAPDMGGFLQPDPHRRIPATTIEDYSLYSYCGSDPTNFVDRDGLERRQVTDSVDIFVSGIGMRDPDAKENAKRLGPNAVGIAVDYGMRMPDILWATADHTTGGYTTRTEEKLWSRLSQYRSIGTLAIYSHGAITTGNLSKKIDEAISRGSMHIDRVVFYGVNPDKNLVSVLKENRVPYSVVAHKFDPVPIITTTNVDLGRNVPVIGKIPMINWMLGGAAKVGVVATLLPGIPGPYSTKYHDINFLDRLGESSSNIDPHRLHQSRELADVIMKQITAAQGVMKKYEISGGDWRVAGPGGRASLEAYSALQEFRQASPTSPSHVGGVYLGNAGRVLEGLGMMRGVRTDDNGNLFLVGEEGADVKLPPLRLDDVVTVFRSVYLYGEGPTVSIDPNPEDPEKSAMVIVHSEATKDTYVGWVLYQADRLMKSYGQGVDNKTEKDVASRVPGYSDILETVYFGSADPRKSQKQGIWERFWIVPAEARRFEGSRRELTLFDVPLKVKTQKMNWEKGKLVDDPAGKSSPGALAFTSWFTENYDAIAAEQLLVPPPESGITEPVPVFTELRRIALITAIAEKLRDQGVPMPFWMRDYEVRKVPFERFTPGLEVTWRRTKGDTIETARIFGGVRLSADSKAIRTYTTAADVTKAAPEVRAQVDRSIKLAARLVKAVADVGPEAVSAPLTLHRVAEDEHTFSFISFPGAETQALAPCRLEEWDLVVPVKGNREIRLVRNYNSFFQPKGPWGTGWAWDLPRLEEIRVPVQHDAKGSVGYRTAYEVLSPLNSVYARYSRLEAAPGLTKGQLLVPDKSGEFLGLTDAKPDFLSGPTHKLLRKDGEVWHFSKTGDLVATERSGFRTVYERDANGLVKRVVGLLGRQLVASIRLEYDTAGRLQRATGQQESAKAAQAQSPATVTYEYDSAGSLAGVRTEAGRIGYRYDGSRLAAVTYQPVSKEGKEPPEVTLRRFEYGQRGQLTAEFDSNGMKTEIRMNADATGTSITVVPEGGTSNIDTVRYDRALRPVEAKYGDGTQASWAYPEAGGFVMGLSGTDGRKTILSESPNQRSRTLELAMNRNLEAGYDETGRLTSLAGNGRTLLRQKWSPDGRLLATDNEASAAHLEYTPDGLLSEIVLAPPGERGRLEHWQARKLDPEGRVREVTDYRGLHLLVDYDASGELAAVINKRDGKNYGFQFVRDDASRIREVQSSWGKQRYSYGTDGLLVRVEMEKGSERSMAEWESGLLRKVRQFDGGEFSLAYYDEGESAGLLRSVTAPGGLVLTYEYDGSSRLSGVKVGSECGLELSYDTKGRLTRWRYSEMERTSQ